ncbi:MAG: hypothetical protein ACRDZW_10530, partial [Acidimicrobiales bacterium]
NNGTTYSYDARNELTSDGSSTYAYTADGDLATATRSGATASFASDAYGQQVTDAASSLSYDGLGRMVSDANQTGGITIALWSTPGLVETRFSPDALLWVAVVFHGTATWRNHGLIISAFVLSNTCPAVLSRCPPDMPGLRPARHRRGWGISSSGTPGLRRGFPGLGQGDAQRHRLRRRRRP